MGNFCWRQVTGWKVKEYTGLLPDAFFLHMLLLQQSPALSLHVTWCPCFFPSTAFVLWAFLSEQGISIGARVIILRFQDNKSASHFQALSLRLILSAFPLALFFQDMFISWNCWRTFVSHALSRLPSAIQLGSLKWWVTIWKLSIW